MKRVLITVMVLVMLTLGAVQNALGQKWTLNTRAWSTNYFTTLI